MCITGGIGIAIEYLASRDINHSATAAVESLKYTLRRRRCKAFIVAQSLTRPKTQAFWKGRLTTARKASLAVLVFAAFDPTYVIYEDVVDLAMWFD